MCLLWGADLRLRAYWQMSAAQDPGKAGLAAGSLLAAWWRRPVSGPEVAPCLPALAVTRLPLCSPQRACGGEGCTQPANSPLVSAESFALRVGQAAC